MAMKGNMNVRNKIVMNNQILEKVSNSNCLGYTITLRNNRDLAIE
jgi:hypothetical protein